jgi:hypothetical protein
MSKRSSTTNVGCGCVPTILLILVLWALWFGLPTPWGKYNIDIFPPRIWLMEDTK